MKTRLCLLFVFSAGLTIVPGTHAADHKTDAASGRVTVDFAAPEKYRDIKEDALDKDGENGRERYLPELRAYLEQRAGYYLKAGQSLHVTVTDIDLAGEYEPWRGPDFDDVRIVKDIYPPRISLAYRWLDAEGKVLKEGKDDLRNLSFNLTLTINTQDPLRYEKDMLDDWLRREMKP